MTAATTPQDTTDKQPFSSDDLKWTAVADRNSAADGVFFYGVITTGVYCRPSCGTRMANRKNVRFFRLTNDAEHAGFRACKRCRPNGESLDERRAAAIANACRIIENSDELPTLATLADAVDMSRFHFHRVFKQHTGLTPKAYALAHRREKLQSELSGSNTVTEAIYNAGFNSSSRFYATASESLGMTPSDFRTGGTNTDIRFAIAQSAMGAILVAASSKGICAILLGDDPDQLARDLQDRFPQAALSANNAEFDQWVATVVGFVEDPKIGLQLPLDIRGTAFQQRVWHALRDIPVGSTASYLDVARKIGSPKAARAIAKACAANALAVAIPCHRVVRSDGSISGYRWGVERKQQLLAREAVQ